MMRLLRRPLLTLTVVGALLLGGTVEAGQSLLNHRYTKHGDSFVEIESVFGTAARNGALPFRVTVKNDTLQDRVWTVRLSDGENGRKLWTESTVRIAVPAGATVEHELVLPFAPEFAAYSYRSIRIGVASPGLEPLDRYDSYQTVSTIPTIAISSKLAARSLGILDKAMSDRNSDDVRFADTFEPDHLPGDWRALTGLDVILIDLESWRELEESPRRAVIEWVRLGGTLDIFGAEQEFPGKKSKPLLDATGIKGLHHARATDAFARLSLGRVHARFWNGTSLDRSDALRYPKLPSRSGELQDHYDTSWDLADRFGTRQFNGAFVFIVLLVFAVLVAPVNLFVFAKAGRRHRLFITTPVISVVASLLVVLFIFVADGIGGRGFRIAFADIQGSPSEMRIYTTQEQVSRTGVMISTGFENKDRPLVLPVRLRASEFNLLDSSSNASLRQAWLGERYDGDWFRSRSEQGYSISSVQPTRARIEVISGEEGKPRLVSNLPVAVEHIVYRDEWGAVWQTPEGGPPIPPGSEIPLEATDETATNSWINEAARELSNGTKTRIRGLSGETGRFFALAVDPADFFVPTHASIDWESEILLLSGNVVERVSASTPASTEPPAQ